MAKMNLKAARVNAGYTQKKAAEMLNVSNKTLCLWEKGERFPNATKIKLICEIYSVSYDDIIFLTSNPL